MRVLLEFRSGSLTGTKISLKPGQPFCIGRTSKAHQSFPDDNGMSGVHFEVKSDEKGYRIRDLASSNGSFVNDVRVAEPILKDGDKIVVGKTHFSVGVEQSQVQPLPRPSQLTPLAPLPQPIAPLPVRPLPQPKVAVPVVPEPKQPEVPPVPATPQERLLTVLRGEFQPLYALLDAAVESDVLKVLFESKEERESLFEGVQGAQLVHFAPHLVRLPPKSPLLETLVQKSWGKNWGVYIACAKPLPELRAHLRQFLVVNLPGNKQMQFRYYDPRILRVFLPTCLPEEINQFFGPVKYFVMEDENPEVLLRFSNSGRGVERKQLALSPGAKAAPDLVPTSQRKDIEPRQPSDVHQHGIFSIRKEQMAALTKVEARTVGNRTLDHIRKTYPKEFDTIGEDKIREVIQHSAKRVAKYGFKGNPDVLKFIEVMVLFGRDFDSDPQLPWAAQILRKRKKPAVKITALHEEAIKRWKSSQYPSAV